MSGFATQADQFSADAIDAMSHRAGVKNVTLSQSAGALAHRPLWAIAHQSLGLSGIHLDMFGDREIICAAAMEMSIPAILPRPVNANTA